MNKFLSTLAVGYNWLQKQPPLHRRGLFALAALTILFASQPEFLARLAKPLKSLRPKTAEASFQPKAPTPFLHVKELLVEEQTRPGMDTISYQRLRNQAGAQLIDAAKPYLSKGDGQVLALYHAAEELGVCLPEAFLKYKWKADELEAKPKFKNGAEPSDPNDLAEQAARDYIEKYHKIAIAEMEKFGIPASIALAQGLVESNAGNSKLAKGNNNHFGIKCFSRRCHKGHCTNMTDDNHKDFFRKYKSSWESWRAHSQLLAGAHYARLKKYGRDYKQWAYGLKELGYATDRTYAEKLIGTIDKYNLSRFDK